MPGTILKFSDTNGNKIQKTCSPGAGEISSGSKDTGTKVLMQNESGYLRKTKRPLLLKYSKRWAQRSEHRTACEGADQGRCVDLGLGLIGSHGSIFSMEVT